MQFFKNFFAASALVSIAAAQQQNYTVTFVNQDSTNRIIAFTSNPSFDNLDPVTVPGNGVTTVNFGNKWQGNFISINEGLSLLGTLGMLGEVNFNSWDGLSWFDVSAIVNPFDYDGVKEIFPKSTNTPVAGCQDFPCPSGMVYNVPTDDTATKSSMENEFICLIGNLGSSSTASKRRRDFAESQRVTRTGEEAKQ